MLKQGRVQRVVLCQKAGSPFQVDGIPERDGRDNQVQPAGAMALILEGAIADFAEPIEKTARAMAFCASPLLRPAVTRRRSAGSPSHSNIKRVRSILPISRRARARLF